MASKGKYYLTTAIAYASGKPHIGNTYEIILSDAMVRYKKYQGYEVFMQTGTDEHGVKIEGKAKKDFISPKAYVDKVAKIIKDTFDGMNVEYDKFIRTTDSYHELQVQKIFKKMYEKGDIYKSSYEGMYCTPCESFWTTSQLVDGKCPDCGRDVKPAKEEAYFFKMSKYAPKLMKHLEDHPDFIMPLSRRNEMINNFLKPGLQDLCVSRTTFKWGIPVDFDPEHVVYVWLDALTNYITGIGYDADGNHSEQFNKLWPADLHVIGKDIVRFHMIYWPIFLMSLDIPLPNHIYAHPWLLQGGEKMSKSKGNVIYADDMKSIIGVDGVRYYCLHEMPYESDGTITWDLIVEKFNIDLVNTMGNLVNRTLSMIKKYFNGVVSNKHVENEIDKDYIDSIIQARTKVDEKIDAYKMADAISEVFNIFRKANKYIEDCQPWALAKDETNKDRLETVMYNLVETIVIGASLISPFLPETSEKMYALVKASRREYEELDKFGLLEDNHEVELNPEVLFLRLDAKEVNEKVKEIQKAQKKEFEDEVFLEVQDDTTIDVFAKCDMKVGQVIACEAIPDSKLLHEAVDIGKGRILSIVSGIQKQYKPEEIVGKKVCVLVNLPPRQMKGYKSEGMLLCAQDVDGNYSLLTFDKDIPVGSKIK